MSDYKIDDTQLAALRRRCAQRGIELEFSGNFPWIYLRKVNGHWINEEDYYLADHGFTVAWYPTKNTDHVIKLTDLKQIFRVIRKYAAYAKVNN